MRPLRSSCSLPGPLVAVLDSNAKPPCHTREGEFYLASLKRISAGGAAMRSMVLLPATALALVACQDLTEPHVYDISPPPNFAVVFGTETQITNDAAFQQTPAVSGDRVVWADNRHGKVDDRPFGGGPGMVMTCQPLFDAVTAVEGLDDRTARRVLLTPQGEPLRQPRVETLARESRLLLIAGHYEGIDERVIDELAPLEISLGDFVTSGGETPALCLIDALVRLVPGVLGHADSAGCESFAAAGPEGSRLLEGPQYTRPRVWRGRPAPEVLLSGDHQAVDAWRRHMMAERTRARRPDLVDTPDRQDEDQ